MQRPARNGRERTTSRKNTYFTFCLLTYICSLIFRIPLLNIIGERGIAFFSIANELYAVTGCVFIYGLSEAVSSLVRYRIRREQFKNADRVLKGALILAFAAGIILSFLFGFTSYAFAGHIAKMSFARLASRMMAPAIVFQALTGVFRGYFAGSGSRMPSIHSMVLEVLFLTAGGLIGAALLHKYGVKAAALLKNADHAAAYGAEGASIGILVSSVLGFLHMLLLYFLYHGKAKKQISRDLQKIQDSGFGILHMLIGTAAPFAAYAVLFRVIPLLDGVLFIRMAKEGVNAVFQWGNYYGKYLVVTGIISVLTMFAADGRTKRIIYYVEREEFRVVREKTAGLIHQTALVAVPSAIFMAVFSENILNLLFKGSNKDTASLIVYGSVNVVLFAFSSLFADILMRLKKMSYVIGYEAIALILHIVCLMILLNTTELSITAVIVSNIISMATLAVCGFLLVSRLLQYKQEWIHAAAFTIIAGAIAGLIVMLINRLLAPAAGSTIALVICLPVGIIIYVVLLILIRAVTQDELEDMPGGGIVIKLGRLMRFM